MKFIFSFGILLLPLMNIQSGQKKGRIFGSLLLLFEMKCRKWWNANRPRKAEREMEDEKKMKMAIRTAEEEETRAGSCSPCGWYLSDPF